MSEQSVVGKRFTIVIPKSVRERLKLQEGQTLIMRVVEERKILVEALPTDPFSVLKRVIGKPYNERTDEKTAEAWIKKRASH